MMTHLLIDLPVVITDEPLPDTLCLRATEEPHWWVTSSRFLLVVHHKWGGTALPKQWEVWDVDYSWFFTSKDNTQLDHERSKYVLPENIGKTHRLLSFKAALGKYPYVAADDTLSSLMKAMPRFDNPGGFRGSPGSIKALQYERGVKCGTLWLTKEAAAKLNKKVWAMGNVKGSRMAYLSKLIMEDQ